MGESIKQRHAGRPEGRRANQRQADINGPQRLGRLGDSRGETALLDRTGSLGFRNLDPAHAQHGQDGNGQNDDPQTTDPLQLLPVPENRDWHVVQAGEHSGTRGCDAGGRFKNRIGQTRIQTQNEGNGTSQADRPPAGDNDQKPITDAQIMMRPPHWPVKPQARQTDDNEAGHKGRTGAIVIDDGKDQRWQKSQADKQQQNANDALDWRVGSQTHQTKTTSTENSFSTSRI